MIDATVSKIRKRDGEIVEFNISKVIDVVHKAVTSSGEIANEEKIGEIARNVYDSICSQYSYKIPCVEEVQDIVEDCLIESGLKETAKLYIRYRQKRNEQRDLVDEKASKRIRKLYAESKVYFTTQMSELVHLRTYSKWIKDEMRRETWVETVDRYIDFMHETLNSRLSSIEYMKCRQYILEMKAMPSMRLMQFAGDAARYDNVCAYNCSYAAIDNLDIFSEALYVLMCGTGFGFSVEMEHMHKLPIIKPQSGVLNKHVIGDSKKGWADALKFGINAWYNGEDVEFNYNYIRPQGTRLSTFGGRASGPAPLKDLLNFTRTKILSKQKRRLVTIDLHDIMCKLGQIVVVGGVRRSALISLSDLDDLRMRYCKSGDFEKENPQRFLANNTAVYHGRPDDVEFMEEWLNLSKFGVGERGIFDRTNANKNMPERRKKFGPQELGVNPCISGDTKIYVADGRGLVSIKELAELKKDIPVFCLNSEGKITVREMRNPRLTKKRAPVYKIWLDDGSFVKTTEDHKFKLSNGNIVKTKDLKMGDSFNIITRHEYSLKELHKEESRGRNYIWTSNKNKKDRAEHVHIAEFYYKKEIVNGLVVHHKDNNPQNNIPENLFIMTKKEHDKLHGIEMIGEKNPMRIAQKTWSKEKWNIYKDKLSNSLSKDKNPRYCGVTNEKLLEFAVKLVKKLGRRFSTNEWSEFANERNLPSSFSSMRSNDLKSIKNMSIIACKIAKLDKNCELDMRIIKTLLKNNGHIVNGMKIFTKKCCHCDVEFETKNKKAKYCSNNCCNISKKYTDIGNKVKLGLKEYFDKKKEYTKISQIKIYNELKNILNKEPMKTEWVKECLNKNISANICRPAAPFKSYSDLKEAASMYNHKFVKLEFCGYEDVYNGTVDEFHNYFIGGFEDKTQNGLQKWTFINTQNCGEVVLRNASLCNLTEIVARHDDTSEVMIEKAKIATLLGTYQSTLTYFPYLSAIWKKNCEEERLLGVSITGQWDCNIARDQEFLRNLKGIIIEENKKYSERLGISQSAAITTGKPSGNLSQLANCSSGAHARKAPFYVRRYRISVSDPLFRMLKDQGVPWHPNTGEDRFNPTVAVMEFPVKSPPNSIYQKDVDAIKQLEHWKMMMENYVEHNQSISVYVGRDEWFKVGNWVLNNWSIINGLAFFPKDDSYYELLPEEEISEEEYNKRIKDLCKLDFSKIVFYEKEDTTDRKAELACSGNACNLEF